MDISKCDGDACPLKHTCIRYTSKPNPDYQVYFLEPPYDELTETCNYYVDTKDKE